MKQLLLIVLVLSTAGCRSVPDDAIVAVLLDSPPPAHLVSCLVVLGKDPSSSLLAKLHAEKRNVVSASACVKTQHGIFFNGARAERLVIHRVKRPLPWSATIECSSSMGPLSGSGWTAHLERVNGNWKVRKKGMRWISMGPNNSFKPKPLRGSA